MLITGGYEIARVAQIPWEDRMNVDGWPSRAGMYCNDAENNLCMRLIDYPVGSTEPRHVHGGTHATTVLKGTTIVDGLTLGPLDVILGPSNEPHGPLHYPQGCQLFSAFQGSYFHSEVEQLRHREALPADPVGGDPVVAPVRAASQSKTLVDRGCGRLLLQALRARAGRARSPSPRCSRRSSSKATPRSRTSASARGISSTSTRTRDHAPRALSRGARRCSR